MLHRILILSAAFTLSLPALAGAAQSPMQGDGRCPIDVASDPDCARAQPYEPSKSSRDQYPRCRNWRAGQPRPAGCRRASVPGTLLAGRESDKRNQFPTTVPQPGHLG